MIKIYKYLIINVKMIGNISGIDFISQISAMTSFSPAVSESILVLAFIWIFIWKGLALWKSSKKNSKIWFIILLVINTFGILEILYYFVFSEINLNKTGKNTKKSRKLIK